MKKVIVFISSVIVLSSCHKEIPKKQSIDIDISGEMQQVNLQTLIQDPANQNNFISAVDSISKYGFGYKLVIPDSLKGKNLKVIYSGSFKETESATGELVLSVHEQNMNTLFWSTYPSNKADLFVYTSAALLAVSNISAVFPKPTAFFTALVN